jgi:hypothetical protein
MELNHHHLYVRQIRFHYAIGANCTEKWYRAILKIDMNHFRSLTPRYFGGYRLITYSWGSTKPFVTPERIELPPYGPKPYVLAVIRGGKVAEETGFEPATRVNERRFSRPLDNQLSTPPFLTNISNNLSFILMGQR